MMLPNSEVGHMLYNGHSLPNDFLIVPSVHLINDIPSRNLQLNYKLLECSALTG